MRFRVECRTCHEGEPFEEYHKANRYWADHANEGHAVELENQAGKMEPEDYVPTE